MNLRIFISDLGFMIASTNYKERLVKTMELKIGDVVEFKKYEDMTEDEISCIAGKYFPKSGKITKIRNDGFFTIEDYGYVFNPESVARVISSKKEGLVMKLEIGDIVEFKKYEDMNDDERMMISKDFFPSYGKIKKINVNSLDEFFNIVGNNCVFSKKSIARVISDVDDVDINSLKPGDEVLMKVTIGEVRKNHIWVSWVDKSDVVEILKRKEPEYFIVQENHYGMYIGFARELVSDKSKAKLHASRDAANEAATDMHLNAWDVIPYDD